MNPPVLPLLPTLDQAPAPVSCHSNPGTVNPANQAYPAPPSSSSSIASAAVVNSNGEYQRGNQHRGNLANCGVTSSAPTSPTINANGDVCQRLDLSLAPIAAPTGLGLPAEVFAGSVSHARSMAPTVAATTPPAVDVHAGSVNHAHNLAPIDAKTTPTAVNVNAGVYHAGGLPASVNIR